jgi:hypothetical protein
VSIRLEEFSTRLLRGPRVGWVRLRPPSLTLHEKVVCVPPSPFVGRRPTRTGGLYDRHGSYIAASGLVRDGVPVLGPAPNAPEVPARAITGQTLYLGVCHNHYGHFLTETLSRLWFLEPGGARRFDHVLIFPPADELPGFVREVFAWLGIADQLLLLHKPTVLTQVWVPEPAVQLPSHVHRQVARLPRLFAPQQNEPQTCQPLFISRSGLPLTGHARVVIGERAVEAALERSGARIFHPQRHSVAEQVHAFRRHRVIVSFAGTALHTMLMAGGGRQVLAYTARPVPRVFLKLDRALGNRARYVSARRSPLAGMSRLATGFQPQLLDARTVLKALRRWGVIDQYELSHYGSAEAEAQQVREYNTAVLLRHLVETSVESGEAQCQLELARFAAAHELDAGMLAAAKATSVLMQQLLP